MTALVFTILAAAFAIGAFVCAMADREMDREFPPISRKREKARLMSEEYRQ